MARKKVKVGLQIRFEVMNVINKNPLKSVKLPSAQEMADKFKMSRRSVNMELKTLKEENWIIGVHGVGVFTNPDAFTTSQNLPSRKIIGIGIRDARQFHYDRLLWNFLYQTGEQLIPDVGYPHFVRLVSHDPDVALQELQIMNLDGFIWGFASSYQKKFLDKLYASGIPVAVYPRKLDNLPCVEVDYEQCGRDIAKILLAEGRKNIAWCAFDAEAEIRLKAARKAGLTIREDMVFTHLNTLESNLRSVLEKGNIPDAFYTHGDSVYHIIALLKEYGIDPFGGSCLLIAAGSVANGIQGFKGIVRSYSYEEIGKKAAALLKLQFSGIKPDSPEKVLMNVQLIK